MNDNALKFSLIIPAWPGGMFYRHRRISMLIGNVHVVLRNVVFLVLIILSLPPSIRAAEKTYPYRWVYVSRNLRSDSHIDDIRRIVNTAADHGLNGMVLAAGYHQLERSDPDYPRRLAEVKKICDRRSVEIIPLFFSAGYGGGVLAVDRNLAAGIPVKDALFQVKNGRAYLVPDSTAQIENGSFESYQGNRIAGTRFHDNPGQVTFVDTKVFKAGKTSVRFQDFQPPHGHGRLMVEVNVKPHRCYRVRLWVKTENLNPPRFRVQVLTPQGRSLAPYDPGIPATADWREVFVGFNSLEYDKVRIYCGIWGGKQGRFWIDDLRIEEVGLLNVLRRPGTPLTVKSAQTAVVYAEGRDYEKITDPRLNFRFDRNSLSFLIPPNSRIKTVDKLLVSYYHGIAINRGQFSVCMSEIDLYEIWRRRARLVYNSLRCNKFLLSMDEIRAGGSCQTCKKRNLSMAQILGDCITKQTHLLRQINPNCEIFIWSDMLDPHHNAHDNYYLIEGDFNGSWKYIPNDLVIVCWYYKMREKSLDHFSQLGFRTLAGAYYDGDTLDNPQGWLEALDRTPKACGIMYTTWQNKYDLLADFGDLVSKKR